MSYKKLKIFWKQITTNKNDKSVIISQLQMTTPYYPQSILAKSKFYGFYTLFYMFTLLFSIVFPALNYIKTGNFFQKAYFKMIETNLYWDVISLIVFIFLSVCLMSVSHITKKLSKNLTKNNVRILFISLIGLLWLVYIGIGLYIVKNYPMYFTDKIFIVVMSWNFFIKTLSYIFDTHEIVKINSKFGIETSQSLNKNQHKQQLKESQQQSLNFLKKSSKLFEKSKLKTKIIYLVSPEIVFKNFVLNYDENLNIHPIYIFNKALVSLLCLFVNLIVMIEIIEPLCEVQNLQKYRFIELFFRFIPAIFYVNICMYFMILENILPAIAEATKMKNRIYYEDWWNSQTVYDFLDKWVLLINGFTKEYLKDLWQNRKFRETLHVAIILFLIFQVFYTSGKGLQILPLIALCAFILVLTYLLGGIKQIQNNHIVHIIIFAWSPLMLTIEMKYHTFTGIN